MVKKKTRKGAVQPEVLEPTVPQTGVTAIVRIGKGVSEDTKRIENREDVILLNVDADSELNARGLTHDGAENFAIDYYLPLEETSFYWQLELLVEGNKTFGPMWREIKPEIFGADEVEAKNWDNKDHPERSIRVQLVDQLGGGGIVTQGVLRILSAFVGRPYEPYRYLDEQGNPTNVESDQPNLAYDSRDDPELHPGLRDRKIGTKRVSLMNDLVEAIGDSGANLVALFGGYDGATGSSGVIALRKAFSAMKQFATIPLISISLPEVFLVNGVVPPEHADRLTVMSKIMDKMIAVAGLGEDGIFWQVVVDNLRTWGGLYSNVNKPAMIRGCAPVLTVIILPQRSDLEPRWLMHLIATTKLASAPEAALAEAQTRVNTFVAQSKLQLVGVRQGADWGVEIKCPAAKSLTINEWEYIAPALAEMQRNTGKVNFEVEVKELQPDNRFWRSGQMREVSVRRMKPVSGVPLIQALAKGVGAETVADLGDKVGYWTLLAVEKALIARHGDLPFGKAFDQIYGTETLPAEFAPIVKEWIVSGLFAKRVVNPTPMTYKDPTTVVVWGQVDVGAETLPDLIFEQVFAKVDRSVADTERLAKKEQARLAQREARTLRMLEQLDKRPDLQAQLLKEGK